MADQENGAATTSGAENGAAADAGAKLRMHIMTQFVRDLSFENVLAQRGTGGEVTPDVQVSVNLDAKKRSTEHQYEVATKLNITSKNKGSARCCSSWRWTMSACSMSRTCPTISCTRSF